jgi:hypothetical protein
MFPPLPPLHFATSTRSGDIAGHTAYGASPMDGSGWTVNMRNSAAASGAVQTRPTGSGVGASIGRNNPLDPQGNIPWLLIVGAIVAVKLLKH